MRRSDLGWAVARVAAGLVIGFFGSQKALGLFGGHGIEATVSGFQQGMGIPPLFAYLAIAGEFLGGLGLIVGLLSRVAGFGVFCTMAVAFMVNFNKGGLAAFSSGDPQAVTGMFFTFLIGMVGLGAVLSGGGQYSLDAKFGIDEKLFGRFGKKNPSRAND